MASNSSVDSQNPSFIFADLLDAVNAFIGEDMLEEKIVLDQNIVLGLNTTAKRVSLVYKLSGQAQDDSEKNLEVTVTEKDLQELKKLLADLIALAFRDYAKDLRPENWVMEIFAMLENPENKLPPPLPAFAKAWKDMVESKVKEDTKSSSVTSFPDNASTSNSAKGAMAGKKRKRGVRATTTHIDVGDDTLVENGDDKAVQNTQGDRSVRKAARRKVPGRLPPSDLPLFDANHPDGIMHDLTPHYKGGKLGWRVNKSYPRPNAMVFGDNGIVIGSWYPRQLALVRDGVHAHPIKAISGNGGTGAYSIVIGKVTKYPQGFPRRVSGPDTALLAVNLDEGDDIWYTSRVTVHFAPLDSNESSSPEFKSTACAINDASGSDVLAKSIETGNPIRVIRKSDGNFEDKPCKGFRFDGMYTAVSKKEWCLVIEDDGNNKVGVEAADHGIENGDETVDEDAEGAAEASSVGVSNKVVHKGAAKPKPTGKIIGYSWTIFKLVRCPGQQDIDTSRPTAEEKRLFKLIQKL